MQQSSNRIRSRAAAALVALALAAPAAEAAAQSATLLRLRNPASLDRMTVDSAGGMVVTGAVQQGAIPATGVGTRMMWYPGKSAFRAGTAVTEWDDANVGFYSAAFGYANTASGSAAFATGGGSVASGPAAVAMGDQATASGDYSVALGTDVRASAANSTALGTNTTANAPYSTALGRYANTNVQQGAFVYGDASTTTILYASAPNQFSVRAAGGYRFFTNAGMSAGVTLAAGGSSWNVVSDRRAKERFLAVDGEDVLARIRTLPVSTWRYVAEEDRTVRHIGPMAQDWKAAFGFSADSTTINSGDFDGVNLAAVQALDSRTLAQGARLRAVEAENAALRAEVDALRARNARLDARLERLERAAGTAP